MRLGQAVRESNVRLRDGEVSITEMMATIAKAYLATGQNDAVIRIRMLTYPRLLQEFQWAIALLNQRGLITPTDLIRAHNFVKDWE